MFESKKVFFFAEASAIAGERAVAADYAVARCDNGNGICSYGDGNGAHGTRPADSLGDFAVTNSFAERNLKQNVPHCFLESCARKQQWHVEGLPFSGKIGLELLRCRFYGWGASLFKIRTERTSEPVLDVVVWPFHQPVA